MYIELNYYKAIWKLTRNENIYNIIILYIIRQVTFINII